MPFNLTTGPFIQNYWGNTTAGTTNITTTTAATQWDSLTYRFQATTANFVTYTNQITVSMNAFATSVTDLDAAVRTLGVRQLQQAMEYGVPAVPAQSAWRLPDPVMFGNYAQYNASFTLNAEEQAKADRKKRRVAARAKKLLAEHLTERELDQLATTGYFEVESSSGRRYRIYRGYSRNVVELDAAGRAVARLCAHPATALPNEDHMLAQRLYLQVAEDEFRRVANHSRIGSVEADQLAA